MEIEGKIIAVLPRKSGVSQRTGNAWEMGEFVLETPGQYPKRCVFQVSGTDRLAQMNIQMGEDLKVYIDIDAHEYNGRWYNNVSAYRVDRLGQQQAQPQGQAAPQAQPQPQAPVQQAPQQYQQAAQPQQPYSQSAPQQPPQSANNNSDLPF